MGKNKAGGTSRPSLLDRWRQRADGLRLETVSLALALRDRRTPWYAKILARLVVAYALSPVDLIPDFIPVLGLLDDLLLVPLGIAALLRLIPAEVMAGARQAARQAPGPESGAGRPGLAMVIFVWLAVLALVVTFVLHLLRRLA